MRSSNFVACCLAIAWLISAGRAPAVQAQEPAPPAAEEQLLVIRLKYVEVDTAQRILETLFEGQLKFKVSTEPLNNSVVVRGLPADLELITALLKDLDEKGPNDNATGAAERKQNTLGKNAQVITLQSSVASKPVNQLREEYRLQEEQIAVLAQQMRQSTSDASLAENNQLLSKLVEIAFQLRQQLQRAELAENARRLERIQQTLDAREGLKSKIVQRRVDELLDRKGDWLTKLDQKGATLGERPAGPAETRQTGSQVSSNPMSSNLVQSANSSDTAASKSFIGESDLLRVSPAQMRQLLEEKAKSVVGAPSQIKRLRDTIQTGKYDTALLNTLRSVEADLKQNQRDLQFAKLQYAETIKYLESAVGSTKEQLNFAMDEYKSTTKMFNVGSASQSEVNKVTIRRRELEVEVQRLESLLKLYRAAGDIPELTEVGRRLDSMISLNIRDSKLGVPNWIAGNGGVTTTPGGYTIRAEVEAGNEARVLFSSVPGHEKSALELKVDVLVSISDSLRAQGFQETDWWLICEVTITDADIQAVIDGKPLRKSFLLKPDGSLVEKNTDSEAADAEKDHVVATLELALFEKAP